MFINWNKDLSKMPNGEHILVNVYNGLFSGGWDFHKALKIGDAVFNAETKKEIDKGIIQGWITID